MGADVVKSHTDVASSTNPKNIDVVAVIKGKEEVLRKALEQENYDSEKLKKLIQNTSIDMYNVFYGTSGKDRIYYKKEITEFIKEQLQELEALKRDIVKTSGVNPFGELMIDSKLWKANQNVIYDTLKLWENKGKYCFWFWSPEDREATLNEWKEKMWGYSMTIVELSLKVKKNKTDVVSTCEKMLRENLIEMLKENSTKEVDEYQYYSVDEIVKNWYGIGKPNPQNPLLSWCKLWTAIVIKDLEELSLTETEQFLQMYEKWVDHAQDTFFIVCGDQSTWGEMFKIQKKYPYVMENSMGL